MEGLFRRVQGVMRVPRLAGAMAAVANAWFVVLWTASDAHEPGIPAYTSVPLGLLLLAAAASTIGLYAFGAAVNDVLDEKRDSAMAGRLRPGRPASAPSEFAIVIIAAALLVAVGGATVFGGHSVLLTLLVAGAVLLFNFAGRFVPGVGMMLLGLVYAGHMLIPNPELRFVWPVWLVMTHALAASCVAHVIGRRVPRLTVRAAIFAVLSWIAWSAALIALGWWRSAEGPALGPVDPTTLARHVWASWVSPWGAIWAGLAAAAFVVVLTTKVRLASSSARADEKTRRYGALWLPLYGMAWLWGAGHTPGAVLIAVLAVASLAAVSLTRELSTLAEHPVGYRR